MNDCVGFTESALALPSPLLERWLPVLEIVHDLGLTSALMSALGEEITDEGITYMILSLSAPAIEIKILNPKM